MLHGGKDNRKLGRCMLQLVGGGVCHRVRKIESRMAVRCLELVASRMVVR